MDDVEIRAAIQESFQPLQKGLQDLTQNVAALVEPLQKAEQERLEKQRAAEEEEREKKMLNRFVNALKQMGVQFKSDVASQTSASPVTKPEQQQETIQGQNDEEEEGRRRGAEEEVQNQAEKPNEEEAEDDEMAKLKKENEDLQVQLKSLQESMPGEIQKALDNVLQEKGWKSIGKAPISVTNPMGQTEEVVLLKGDEPTSREDLIGKLMHVPLAQLNDMRTQYLAGTLTMPEVN